jgi:hypothetical protein
MCVLLQLQPVQSMQISATMNGYSQTLNAAGLGEKQHDSQSSRTEIES